MMIDNRLIVLLLLLLLLVPLAHGQGVHVHGLGKLQVVSEGEQLNMLLTLPAMDVLGFEHAPSSDAQRAAVDNATERFNRADQIVQPSVNAKCSIVAVSVTSAMLESAQNKHRHHHHGHDHEDDHADFIVEYLFSCSRPEHLKQIRLMLFEWLKDLELHAEVVSAHGAHAATLDRRNLLLSLGSKL